MVRELGRHYIFPPSLKILEECKGVRRVCVTSQVCDPPNFSTSLPLSSTPVPDTIMTSVALDIFALPPTKWKDKEFDSLLVCVDRLSGWIVAWPCAKKGLTAEKAAHLIFENGWEAFGIPSVLTSDQGPQFVGQFWRTMCARLGIRHAYSQAYRPQANGRAEVAGKTLISILRKFHTEETLNWVEALPRVLRVYHDTPGESGFSPYQIVFGRDRNLAGVPYTHPRECEGATEFFERCKNLEKIASEKLKSLHKTEISNKNASRAKPPPYGVGDWVWVLRPRNSGVTKLETWWVGPCEVVRRTGDLSYEVRVKPNVVQDLHCDQMKPFQGDRLNGSAIELFHHMSGYTPLHSKIDEWEVERIRRHRRGGPMGNMKF